MTRPWASFRGSDDTHGMVTGLSEHRKGGHMPEAALSASGVLDRGQIWMHTALVSV